MHNNKPGRGFIGALNWLVRRLRCPHSRTFTMYPENVHWHRNGEHMGTMKHGAVLTCCMDCGQTWATDYAE